MALFTRPHAYPASMNAIMVELGAARREMARAHVCTCGAPATGLIGTAWLCGQCHAATRRDLAERLWRHAQCGHLQWLRKQQYSDVDALPYLMEYL